MNFEFSTWPIILEGVGVKNFAFSSGTKLEKIVFYDIFEPFVVPVLNLKKSIKMLILFFSLGKFFIS